MDDAEKSFFDSAFQVSAEAATGKARLAMVVA